MCNVVICMGIFGKFLEVSKRFDVISYLKNIFSFGKLNEGMIWISDWENNLFNGG